MTLEHSNSNPEDLRLQSESHQAQQQFVDKSASAGRAGEAELQECQHAAAQPGAGGAALPVVC